MRKRKTQRNIPYNLGGYFPRRALLICGLSLGMSWIVEAVQAEVSGNSDLSVLSAQQNRSISGKVVDENGEVLIGVSKECTNNHANSMPKFGKYFLINKIN